MIIEFSRQEYWSGLPFPSPGDLPDPGIEPRFPTLQADTLTSEPPGKPCVTLCDPRDCSPWNSSGQNTRVGSLSLLQGIFPTQGSNPGLPHCRPILYPLSHKGNPRDHPICIKESVLLYCIFPTSLSYQIFNTFS